MNSGKVIIEAGANNTRLDKYLASARPGLGLRGARRLAKSGAVLVNGRAQGPAHKLVSGDMLEITDFPFPEAGGAYIAGRQGDYYFFHKPRGMHTTALAGSNNPSLEAVLPRLMGSSNAAGEIRLLQRLDRDTSGLICGAASLPAQKAYRQAEASDKVEKSYLALLEGEIRQAGYVKNLLDADNRKRVRVLGCEAPPGRWTLFEPLCIGAGVSLVRCTIKRGQRHQIRAHAAALGYPLSGDALYGQAASSPMLLICYAISFPGHSMAYLSPDAPVIQIFPKASGLLRSLISAPN